MGWSQVRLEEAWLAKRGLFTGGGVKLREGVPACVCTGPAPLAAAASLGPRAAAAAAVR